MFGEADQYLKKRLPWPATMLIAASAYLVACLLNYPSFVVGDQPPLALPAAGVGLAAVVFGGWPGAVGVLLGALAHVAIMRPGLFPFLAISHAVGGFASALFGGMLLSRALRIEPRLSRLTDLLWFFLVGVLGSGIIASVITTLVLFEVPEGRDADLYRVLLRLWIANGCGTLVVAPFILTWVRRDWSAVLPERRDLVDRTLTLFGTILTSLIAFPDIFGLGRLNIPVALLPFPLVIWAALRHGNRSVSLNILVGGMIASIGTAIHSGAFAYQSPFISHATLFAYFMVYVGLALILSVLMEERRGVEAKLRSSENRLELAIRGAGLGTWDWNIATGEIAINDRWAEMLGYTIEEVGSRVGSRAAMLHPDDIAPTAKRFQEHLRGRTPFFENEHRMKAKDGQWKWILDRGMVVERDEKGIPLRASGIHQDIDARKRAEGAVRSSEERLSKIINSTPNVAIQGYDREGRVLFWNKASERLYGWSAEHAVGKMIGELIIDGTQAAEFLETIRGIESTGKPVENTEWIYRTRDGLNGTVFSSIFSIPDPEGGQQFVCMDVDITERKRAEEELRESQRLYSTLVGNLPGMTYRCRNDKQWTMAFVSRGSIALSGYDPEELIDNTVVSYSDLIHPDDRQRVWREVQQAVDRREGFQLAYRIRDRKGAEKWVWEQGCGVFGSDGDLLFLEGFITDDTPRRAAEGERKNLETQLMHTQKLESLGVMAGGIAHHFNNMLLGIQGNAELALVQSRENPPARKYIENIVQSSQRAADLCNQMLAYSGKGRFSMAPVQLTHLVQEMEHLIRVGVGRNCEIIYKLSEKMPPIQADPAQMRQVILNLLTNASDALSERGGTVTVTTGFMEFERGQLQGPAADEPPTPGRYVYFEVTDTGGGMDPETRSRIFDPFFTTKFVGRGLGLAAVLGIVRAHRGTIYVISSPGRGSTFRILFPPLAAPPLMATASQIWRTWRASGRILLIDDEELIRDLGKSMIQQFGFEVVVAATGEQGIEIFAADEGKFDLVILDLTMPGIGGAQTLEVLTAMRPDLRVLISSGSTSDSQSRPDSPSVVGTLPKPYGPQELFERLRELF